MLGVAHSLKLNRLEMSFFFECCRNLMGYHQICSFRSSPKNTKNITMRDPCPVPAAPPPPPRKQNPYLWGFFALAGVVGGFAVYAKGKQEIRDWLTIYLPWFDDFIAVLHQENMTYEQYVRRWFDDLTNPPDQCALDNSTKLPCGVESPPPDASLDNICELEQCIKDLAASAIDNYASAKESCAHYNQIVEDSTSVSNVDCLEKLKEVKEIRDKQIKSLLRRAKGAKAKIEEMATHFDCGEDKSKMATLELISECLNRIKRSSIEFEWEKDKSTTLDNYWQKVLSMMTKFKEENETMFPGLNYSDEKPKFYGDPDLYLFHAYRTVRMYETELDEASAKLTEKINRAVDALPPEPEKSKTRDKDIATTTTAQTAAMKKHVEDMLKEQKDRNDNDLKDALSELSAKLEEKAKKALEEKEKQAEAIAATMIQEKLASEGEQYRIELENMKTMLKQIEDKLEAHMRAEGEVRLAQDLWAAGSSLLAATKKGEPYVNVQKELKAIKKISEEDSMAQAVLNSIPKSVKEKGVVPESVVRDHYRRMEKCALQVALVDQDGGPLFVYFLSWLQALMLSVQTAELPKDEAENMPKNPSEDLDTFELLQRARYWVDRGNFSAALRYVEALEGASRAAAHSWREEARSHIETKQAAEALIAHASAMGVQYL